MSSKPSAVQRSNNLPTPFYACTMNIARKSMGADPSGLYEYGEDLIKMFVMASKEALKRKEFDNAVMLANAAMRHAEQDFFDMTHLNAAKVVVAAIDAVGLRKQYAPFVFDVVTHVGSKNGPQLTKTLNSRIAKAWVSCLDVLLESKKKDHKPAAMLKDIEECDLKTEFLEPARKKLQPLIKRSKGRQPK